MASNRSLMKTAVSQWFSTASCLITSSGGTNYGRADIGSLLTAIRRSSLICGKITETKCGNGCEGNSPSHYGTSAADNFNLAATGSGSRHFFGRGKMIGYCSRPKLKDLSHRAWFRFGQIVEGSIMSSLSQLCRVRELVSRVSSF